MIGLRKATPRDGAGWEENALEVDLTGATRLHVIVGDPIAQVKSPAGVTRSFLSRGHDGIVVPVHVVPADLGDFLRTADRVRNLDGIISTIPHKFGCFAHCASTTPRAAFLGAVNVMRRRPDGRWHGDMVDGQGMIAALAGKGVDPVGRRVLVAGAGGAGSAIALALVDAGAAAVAIHEIDFARRDDLVARLAARGPVPVAAGTVDPSGYDLVINATPAGMKPDDPYPFDVTRLAPSTFVACLQTGAGASPVVAAARAAGCPTSNGADLFEAQQETIAAFLLYADERAAR